MILDVFKKVNQSNYLCGKTEGGFKAPFDWIIKINNFQKILEGNYSSNKGQLTHEEKFGFKSHGLYDKDVINELIVNK